MLSHPLTCYLPFVNYIVQTRRDERNAGRKVATSSATPHTSTCQPYPNLITARIHLPSSQSLRLKASGAVSAVRSTSTLAANDRPYLLHYTTPRLLLT